jgi:membrane fusion protein, multidrug efflux system
MTIKLSRLFFLTLILTVFSLSSCSKTKKENVEKAVSDTMAVKQICQQTIPQSIPSSGTISALRLLPLINKVAGSTLSDINVKNGDKVTKGQVLFKFNNASVVAKREAAKDNQVILKKQYAQYLKGFKSGAISPDELNLKKQAYQQAQADYAAANQQYQDLTITAPFAGIITKRMSNLEVNQTIAVNTALAELDAVDKNNWKVEYYLPAAYINFVRPNAKISVNAFNKPSLSANGKVISVSMALDSSQRFLVTADMQSKNIVWVNGQFVQVTQYLPSLEDVLVVPSLSVMVGPQGASVFVATNKNKTNVATRVPVVVGHTVGDDTIIKSGLAPGAWVMTKNFSQLKNGQKVSIIKPPIQGCRS